MRDREGATGNPGLGPYYNLQDQSELGLQRCSGISSCGGSPVERDTWKSSWNLCRS